MAGKKRGKRSRLVERWEIDYVTEFAKKVERREPDELAAELLRQLVVLKAHPPSKVEDWNAYLATFLRNKAGNWFRDRRTRTHGTVSLDKRRTEDSDETFSEGHPEPAMIAAHDFGIAFAQAWEELGPKLQRFWLTLVEVGGDQTAAAKRARKHRNTAILWIKKIRAIMRKHGIEL